MDAILIKLIPIAYLVAAGSFFLYLFRGDTTTRLPAALLLSGFVVHSFALTTLFFQEGFAAVAVMGDALLFNSWLMVGIYLLIQLKYRLTVLGGIIAPLAFLMTFAAFAVGGRAAGIPNFLAAAARDFGVPRQCRLCARVRRELDLSTARTPPQAQESDALDEAFSVIGVVG